MEKEQFTYQEIGAFLIAIGNVMSSGELCAGAANDGGNDNEIEEILRKEGVDEDRIRIVSAMPIDFAISYIAPIRGVEHNYN